MPQCHEGAIDAPDIERVVGFKQLRAVTAGLDKDDAPAGVLGDPGGTVRKER